MTLLRSTISSPASAMQELNATPDSQSVLIWIGDCSTVSRPNSPARGLAGLRRHRTRIFVVPCVIVPPVCVGVCWQARCCRPGVGDWYRFLASGRRLRPSRWRRWKWRLWRACKRSPRRVQTGRRVPRASRSRSAPRRRSRATPLPWRASRNVNASGASLPPWNPPPPQQGLPRRKPLRGVAPRCRPSSRRGREDRSPIASRTSGRPGTLPRRPGFAGHLRRRSLNAARPDRESTTSALNWPPIHPRMNYRVR